MNQQNNEIPEEAQGLCWGGFFFTFIWGIFHKVWISLLVFIPVIGLFIPFILLFKGREWAWDNGDWESSERFNKSQKIWTIVGLILFGLGFFGGILAAILLPNMQKMQAKAKTSEAKLSLVMAYTGLMQYQVEAGRYPDKLTQIPDADQIKTTFYKITSLNDAPSFEKYCSDCKIYEKSFKIMAVGNLDADDTMDVWTVDQDRNMIHLINDLED